MKIKIITKNLYFINFFRLVMWDPHGTHMVPICFLYGSHMVPNGIPQISQMGLTWFPHGYHKDPQGSHMGPTWFPHASHVGPMWAFSVGIKQCLLNIKLRVNWFHNGFGFVFQIRVKEINFDYTEHKNLLLFE